MSPEASPVEAARWRIDEKMKQQRGVDLRAILNVDDVDAVLDELDSMRARLAEREATIAALDEALRKVAYAGSDRVTRRCDLCCYRDGKHSPDCVLDDSASVAAAHDAAVIEQCAARLDDLAMATVMARDNEDTNDGRFYRKGEHDGLREGAAAVRALAAEPRT